MTSASGVRSWPAAGQVGRLDRVTAPPAGRRAAGPSTKSAREGSVDQHEPHARPSGCSTTLPRRPPASASRWPSAASSSGSTSRCAVRSSPAATFGTGRSARGASARSTNGRARRAGRVLGGIRAAREQRDAALAAHRRVAARRAAPRRTRRRPGRSRSGRRRAGAPRRRPGSRPSPRRPRTRPPRPRRPAAGRRAGWRSRRRRRWRR